MFHLYKSFMVVVTACILIKTLSIRNNKPETVLAQDSKDSNSRGNPKVCIYIDHDKVVWVN